MVACFDDSIKLYFHKDCRSGDDVRTPVFLEINLGIC